MSASKPNETSGNEPETQLPGEGDVARKVCGCPETAPNRELSTITQGRMKFCASCDTRIG